MSVERAKPVLSPAAQAAARRRQLPAVKPIPAIVHQHAEEAAWLWSQRDRAVRAPHYNLTLLDRLDERVDAHVDGLRVAGDFGWEVAVAGVAPDQPGGVFSAAVLAFGGGAADRIQAVIEAAAAAPPASRAAAAALAWLPWKRAEVLAKPWLESPAAGLRRLAVAAFSLHRRDPGAGLLKALADADAGVRARGLKAIGELGLLKHAPLAQRALGDADPAVAFSAAWTTALLSKDPNPLVDLLKKDRRFADRGIPLAARLAGAGWAGKLPPRLAILAAGHAGDVSAIPGLLEQMKTPVLARVAGEAFSMITGADLGNEPLEGKPPKDFEAGPTDDPADPNVDMDADGDLPWPDIAQVEKWWKGKAGGFKPGVRHLAGRPMEAAHLRDLLKSAYQRVRTAAALELALLEPGRPLFETRAPGFRQKAALGANP